MDYINNKGEKIGLVDQCRLERQEHHRQQNPRCHDRHHTRPQYGQGCGRNLRWRFALREVTLSVILRNAARSLHRTTLVEVKDWFPRCAG